MHWKNLLNKAAGQFDGGPRSFPLSSEAGFANNYAYEPPNEDYQRLFFRQATVSGSQLDELSSPHSAGWLIPDDTSICKPVFVAHSVLSAIWLLRETLADDALSDDGWDRLVCAAESLAQDGVKEPPSAQKPSASPLLDRSRKRPAPSTQASSPKRTRIEADGTPPASSRLSEPSELGDSDSGRQPVDPPRHITTVTNHNRRAERQRGKKLDASLLKKRLLLGLVAPVDEAPRQEHAAYASIAPQDEPVVAWIIKQPVSPNADFYATARTPYRTSCSLLEKARALGNQPSRYHAAQFLQSWRELGTPFRGRLAGRQHEPSSQQPDALMQRLRPKPKDNLDNAFCFAWNMCTRYEGELAAVHIEYRWVSALLGKAYADKMAQIRHNDFVSSNDRTRNRYGKGPVRTEAIADLMKLVYPSPTDKDKLVFRRRLARATRWFEIAKLGWGILTLIPHEEIAISWIEQTLRVTELHVWIELVKKERPDICDASKALETWLGPEGISGGPISEKKTLSIEAGAPTSIYEVEEVQDSEDDDQGVEGLDTQATLKSPTPTLKLRQLTLLELFNPLE